MADHAASLRYGTSKGYAASLLSLADSRPAAADRPLRRRPIVPPSEKSEAHSPLFQRMLMLLHCPFPVEQTVSRRWSWSLRLVVIVASLGSACLCIRWPHARALEQPQGSDAAGISRTLPSREFRRSPSGIHSRWSRSSLPHARCALVAVRPPSRSAVEHQGSRENPYCRTCPPGRAIGETPGRSLLQSVNLCRVLAQDPAAP